MRSTRRSLLTTFLTLPLITVPKTGTFAQTSAALPLTPACHDGDEPTLEREAGPYFKPDSPYTQELSPGAVDEERLTVTGFVVDTRCRPIGGSLVEIWHADGNGKYDQEGFRFRGHQFTDPQGRWWFSTIVPALYPGRTRHFHFKVQRPGGNVLTTQLYFPGEPGNVRDRLFHETLLLDMEQTADGRFGRFNFVV